MDKIRKKLHFVVNLKLSMLSHEGSHSVPLINNTKLYPDVSLYMVIIIIMMMMMMKLIIIVNVVGFFFYSLW